MNKLKISDEEAFQKFERDCLIRNLRTETLRYYKEKIAATKSTQGEIRMDKQLQDYSSRIKGEDLS